MNTDETAAEGQVAGSAGRLLKAERERRGLSEKEAADALRITMHYLRFVETDRYDKLPGAVFAKGYVRSYAQLLELNVDEVMALYELNASPVPEVTREKTLHTIIQRAPRQPREGFPWLMVSVIAFVVGFVSVWAYSRYFASADELGAHSTVSQAPQLASEDETEEPDLPVTPQSSLQPMAEGPAVVLEAAPVNDVLQVGSQRVIAVSNPGTDILQIRFSGESWIEVSDGGSAAVYRDIREAGDVLQFTGAAPFNVLLGDAPYATLEFNGEALDMSNQIRIDNSARLTVGS